MKDYVDGLYVKDGRPQNSRPNSISGIEQAAQLRKMVKYNDKVDMIADGIARAEYRKMF